MKIKFIHPKDDSSNYLKMRRGFGYPLLTFPVLAAYTPEYVDEIEIIDEEFEEIDFDDPVDLVGITTMTYLAPRAFEIAASFRKRGVKVIMGGMHVSALPDEALQFADSVVVGEGEEVWPKLVEDFRDNRLKSIYKAPKLFDMEKYKSSRLDLFKKFSQSTQTSNSSKYSNIVLFEVSRGCPYDCDFCAVTHFYGKQYRFRDLEQLIQAVREAKLKYRARLVGFVDDNLYGNKMHFHNFLKKIRKLNIMWSGQVSANVGKDEDTLKMMADSGCQGVFIGFESLSQKSLNSINKKINKVDQYHRLLDMCTRNNIMVFPSIIFGLDGDGPDIFEKTLSFLECHREIIGYCTFNIICPLPGTRFYQRMKQENRIIKKDWKCFDFTHAVVKPKSMSVEELQKGYDWISQKFDAETRFAAVTGNNRPDISRDDRMF